MKKKVIKNWTAVMPNTKAKSATKSWKKPTEKERMEKIMQKTKYKEEKKPRVKKQIKKDITVEHDQGVESESPQIEITKPESKTSQVVNT